MGYTHLKTRKVNASVWIEIMNPPFTKTHLLEDGGYPADFVPLNRMKVWEPEAVAALGVEAFERGRILCIPGFDNRLLHFLMRFMPGASSTGSRGSCATGSPSSEGAGERPATKQGAVFENRHNAAQEWLRLSAWEGL